MTSSKSTCSNPVHAATHYMQQPSTCSKSTCSNPLHAATHYMQQPITCSNPLHAATHYMQQPITCSNPLHAATQYMQQPSTCTLHKADPRQNLYFAQELRFIILVVTNLPHNCTIQLNGEFACSSCSNCMQKTHRSM